MTFSKIEGRTYGGGADGDFGTVPEPRRRTTARICIGSWWRTSFRDDVPDCDSLGLPPSCIEDLERHVGEPVSTINRFGDLNIDRPLILKVHGYKAWDVGRHELSLGGIFTWQSGTPWQRSGTLVSAGPLSREDRQRDQLIDLFFVPRGAFEHDDFHQLNSLSLAGDFPLSGSRAAGARSGWRPSTSPPNRNSWRPVARRGAPLRSRRSFQEPRKLRLVGSVRF